MAPKIPVCGKIEDIIAKTLTYRVHMHTHCLHIRTNNVVERLSREIRRHTRVVGIFPNPESYLRMVTVYLMEYSEDWSVTRFS